MYIYWVLFVYYFIYFTGKWLACQAMDNQIVIFNVLNRFKFMRKKVFKGHMVAGYACTVDFSPEMRWVKYIYLKDFVITTFICSQ